jgi:hypothetical protein
MGGAVLIRRYRAVRRDESSRALDEPSDLAACTATIGPTAEGGAIADHLRVVLPQVPIP